MVGLFLKYIMLDQGLWDFEALLSTVNKARRRTYIFNQEINKRALLLIITKEGDAQIFLIQFVGWYFIEDLLMQDKFHCENLISRSWRTWKMNRIKPTYLSYRRRQSTNHPTTKREHGARSVCSSWLAYIYIHTHTHIHLTTGSHGSQVPLKLASPNMEAKAQLVSLKEAIKKRGFYSSKSDMNYFMQDILGHVSRARSRFSLDPTLHTSPKPPGPKKCCHVGIHIALGTWDLYETGESQLACASTAEFCTDWPRVEVGLRTRSGTRVNRASYTLPTLVGVGQQRTIPTSRGHF